MAEILSEEQVADVQARASKATEGPWCWEQYGDKVNGFSVGVACFEDGTLVCGKLPEDEHVVDTLLFRDEVGSHEAATINYADAEFISHARTDVPNLCDTIKALYDQLDALKAENQAIRAENERLKEALRKRDTDCWTTTQP